jgi:hypothetical protein
MKRKSGLTAKQWQLLSAYLDNQLSRDEIDKVDELLQANPESTRALEQLRRAKVMLSSLPSHRNPRNFLVTQEMVKKPFLLPVMSVLQYSSAISALLLIIVLALDFLPGFQRKIIPAGQEKGESQELIMESAQAPSVEGPAIIYWGAPAPIAGVYGKGGGGGGEGMGIGGGGAEGIGGAPPAASAAILPPEVPMDAVEAIPDIPEEEILTEEKVETAEQERMDVESQLEQEPLRGTGPILGIPSDEMQGKILNLRMETDLERHTPFPVSLRTLEIILLVLVFITVVPALFLSKRK